MNDPDHFGAPAPGGGTGIDRGQRPRRRHVSKACGPCRKKKSKCNGQRPICHACFNADTPEACSWDGLDGRQGCAADITALQERVGVLEGAPDLQGRVQHLEATVQALVNQIGWMQNMMPNLQRMSKPNQPPPTPASATAPPPYLPISAVNPDPALPQLHNGGNVYLPVQPEWGRQPSAVVSTDSGFATEVGIAPRLTVQRASPPTGHGLAASARGLPGRKLSVEIPGFTQPPLTPAPESTPSSGAPASAMNFIISPSHFARSPGPQSSNSSLHVPVVPGWNNPHSPGTPSSASSFSSQASSIISPPAGHGFANPLRGPQNPVFSHTAPHAASQVPPTPASQSPHSPAARDPAGGIPLSFASFALFQSSYPRVQSMSPSDSVAPSQAPGMSPPATGPGFAAAGCSRWHAVHTPVTPVKGVAGPCYNSPTAQHAMPAVAPAADNIVPGGDVPLIEKTSLYDMMNYVVWDDPR